MLSESGLPWASGSTQGCNTNITGLQVEYGYTDGSTGLEILRANVTDATNDELKTNYPAWDYACNYGKNQGLTTFQTDWYLPSKEELKEVYDKKNEIEAALAQTGVSKTSFGSGSASYYWSSSQYASNDIYAWRYYFDGGGWGDNYKGTGDYYVCAVRQFTWQ